MRIVRATLLCALCLTLCSLPSMRDARAVEPALLRIATLAPAGSSAERLLRAFDGSLQKRTGGRLKTRFYAGGVAGDERDVIRKMRVGQLEGAALTSIGLGQLVRSVLVLQLPGLFENREQLAKVRAELAQEFAHQFEAAGYVLLGWGDVGERRLFSQKPLLSPSDFKTVRPWVWREDPISSELMTLIGANGVPLGLPEVMAALQTRMVDTVTATALAAVGLQWFRFVKCMSKATGEPVVGATVVRKAWFDALAPDVQQTLRETSAQLESQMREQVQREDERAAATLRGRGVQEFDMMSHRAEWEPILRELAKRLTGKLYSRELLARAYTVAHGAPPPP